MIKLISINDIDRAFNDLMPLIEQAITNKRFTQLTNLASIYQELVNSRMQLWYCQDEKGQAVVLTTVVSYPETKILELNYTAGHNVKDLFKEAILEFKQFAKQQHCQHIRGFGRKGWLKYLDDYKVMTNWEISV